MVSELRKRSRRKCFVVSCGSNADDNPNKIFLCVPRNPEIRKKWFEAVGLPNAGPNRSLYCCEDHFDLESDCRNWMFYKLMGSRMRLKTDVVPHKFNCQGNLKGTNYSQLPSSDRRLKLEMMKKIKEEISLQKLEAKNLIRKIDEDKGSSLSCSDDEVLPALSSVDNEVPLVSPGVETDKPELLFEVNDKNVTITSHTAVELELDFGNEEKHKLTTRCLILERGVLPDQFESQIRKPRMKPSSPPHPDGSVVGSENNKTQEKIEDHGSVKREDIPEELEYQFDKPHEHQSPLHPGNVFIKDNVDLGKMARYDPDSSDDENGKSSSALSGIDIRMGYGNSEAEAIGIDPEDLEEHMMNQKSAACCGRIDSSLTEENEQSCGPMRKDITSKPDSVEAKKERARILSRDRHRRWLERLTPMKREELRDKNRDYRFRRKLQTSSSEIHRRKNNPRACRRKISSR